MKEARTSKAVLRTRLSRAAAALLVGLGALMLGAPPWQGHDANAYVRGGFVAVGGGGGGYVAVGHTTVVRAGGIRRFLVAPNGAAETNALAYVPPSIGGTPGGQVGYTARNISIGAITAGPSTGDVYRYGARVSRLPSGCTAAFWQGAAAYRCSGKLYAYDLVDGATAYYPIEES